MPRPIDDRNPVRPERKNTSLVRQLKRAFRSSNVVRDDDVVSVIYDGKKYKVWWEDSMNVFLVSFFDPQLGSAPKGADTVQGIVDIIKSDPIKEGD